MPVAFVQLKTEAAGETPGTAKPTASELRAFVRERIAPYKTPRVIYFIETKPLTPTGKVLKRALVVPARPPLLPTPPLDERRFMPAILLGDAIGNALTARVISSSISLPRNGETLPWVPC